jgi:hypothetical protein
LSVTTAFADEAHALQESLDTAQEQVSNFARREKVFGWPPSTYVELTAALGNFEPYYLLWTFRSDFLSSQASWMDTQLSALSFKDLKKNMDDWWKVIFVALT